MDRQKALHYRDRAESFLRLARLGTNAEVVEGWIGGALVDYEDGVALLAVHAGIAFSDALLVHLTGQRSTAQDHQQAASRLEHACATHRLDSQGVKHFRWLVLMKDTIAYGDRRVPSDVVRSAIDHVEKLARWVYRIVPELGLNGDEDVDGNPTVGTPGA